MTRFRATWGDGACHLCFEEANGLIGLIIVLDAFFKLLLVCVFCQAGFNFIVDLSKVGIVHFQSLKNSTELFNTGTFKR